MTLAPGGDAHLYATEFLPKLTWRWVSIRTGIIVGCVVVLGQALPVAKVRPQELITGAGLRAGVR